MQQRNKRRRRISRTYVRLWVRPATQPDPVFAQNSSLVRKSQQGRYRLLSLLRPSPTIKSTILTSKCWYTSINIRLDEMSIRRSRARSVSLDGWLAAARRTFGILGRRGLSFARSLARSSSETFAIFFPCFISDGRTNGGGGRRARADAGGRGRSNDEITRRAASVATAAVHSFSVLVRFLHTRPRSSALSSGLRIAVVVHSDRRDSRKIIIPILIFQQPTMHFLN